MDFSFLKDKKIILIIILLILTILLGTSTGYLYFNDKECKTEPDIILNEVVEKEEVIEEIMEEYYYVDIKGAVKNPGVYKISKGNMVTDLITLAGGLKSNASTKYINLSYELKNHEVINIYTTSEVKKSEIKMECSVPTYDITDCNNSSIVSNGNTSNNNVSSNSNKVNINTATKDVLMSINGIGESKADAIIEYRTSNGNFKTIEDIKNVSGIGDSLYNQIKEYIEV